MNWVRMVLDGFMMAAYFNLFAAAVAIYNPRLMFPCYPPSIIKDAPEPPTKGENRFYMLWICFGEILPLIIYGSVSMIEGGTRGFGWMVLHGYIQWMMIGFADLFFLDVWLIQKKCRKRFIIPGTEGHPGYEFKAWIEKLCPAGTSAPVAIASLSGDGFASGRTGSFVSETIIVRMRLL